MVVAALLLGGIGSVLWWTGTAGAAPSAGAVPLVGDGGTSGRSVPEPTTARRPRYVPPVPGRVVDPFRAPAHEYGPGNRGLEYAVDPGTPVRAIGPGVVAFAGQVAGRLVVSVVHPDGLRSSLTGLATLRVRAGQFVDATSVLGTAAARLHLGVRRAGRYIDPASLFVDRRPTRSVLVPAALRLAAAGPSPYTLGRSRTAGSS